MQKEDPFIDKIFDPLSFRWTVPLKKDFFWGGKVTQLLSVNGPKNRVSQRLSHSFDSPYLFELGVNTPLVSFTV
jgi:hypothetical protein